MTQDTMIAALWRAVAKTLAQPNISEVARETAIQVAVAVEEQINACAPGGPFATLAEMLK